VGGAPLNQEYADSIGADGYASDASGAVDLASGLLS
ncbi:MAG: cobalamin-binding protein, partial [Actinobacteria bacterium]|nr:cobalamin-binding protein [Actinomycetota bacterium]